MAKGSLLMGTLTGKLGESVFSRRNGEQVSRAYIRHPKNPNTVRQSRQRTQIANIVNFYRSAKTLLDHSMTGRKSQRSSYNEFVSANLNKVKVFLPKSVADKQGCIVAPYQVSRGSLPAIEISGAGDNAVTNLAVGSLTINATTTIGQLTEALLDNNASIQSGDQLSYVSFIQGQNVQLGMPTMTVGYYEITLDLSSSELVSSYWPAQAYNVTGGFIAHGDHVANGGFCWILSRKLADGSLAASPQVVIMNDYTLLSQYQGGLAIDTATRSYNAASEAFLTPGSDLASGLSTAVNVSSLKIGSRILSAGSTSPLPITTTATAVVVTGSNLSAVTAASLKLNGVTVAGTDVEASDNQVTFNITSTTSGNASSVELLLDNKVVFTWQQVQTGGGDGEDPLG